MNWLVRVKIRPNPNPNPNNLTGRIVMSLSPTPYAQSALGVNKRNILLSTISLNYFLVVITSPCPCPCFVLGQWLIGSTCGGQRHHLFHRMNHILQVFFFQAHPYWQSQEAVVHSVGHGHGAADATVLTPRRSTVQGKG